jgi:hypothetical protein
MDLLVPLTPGMLGIRLQYMNSRTWRIHRYKCKGLMLILSHVKYLYFTVSGPERFNNFAHFLVSAPANGKIYSSQLSRGDRPYSLRYSVPKRYLICKDNPCLSFILQQGLSSVVLAFLQSCTSCRKTGSLGWTTYMCCSYIYSTLHTCVQLY